MPMVIPAWVIILPLVASGSISEDEGDKIAESCEGSLLPANWREAVSRIEMALGRKLIIDG